MALILQNFVSQANELLRKHQLFEKSCEALDEIKGLRHPKNEEEITEEQLKFIKLMTGSELPEADL